MSYGQCRLYLIDCVCCLLSDTQSTVIVVTCERVQLNSIKILAMDNGQSPTIVPIAVLQSLASGNVAIAQSVACEERL